MAAPSSSSLSADGSDSLLSAASRSTRLRASSISSSGIATWTASQCVVAGWSSSARISDRRSTSSPGSPPARDSASALRISARPCSSRRRSERYSRSARQSSRRARTSSRLSSDNPSTNDASRILSMRRLPPPAWSLTGGMLHRAYDRVASPLHGRNQDVGHLRSAELLRRPLTVREHRANLRARKDHAVIVLVRARFRRPHPLALLAVEGVLEVEGL